MIVTIVIMNFYNFVCICFSGCELFEDLFQGKNSIPVSGRWEFLVMDFNGYLLRFAQSFGEKPV